MGDPITVPPDAGPEEMERLRAAITRAIEAANEKAPRLADGDRP